MRKTFWMTLAIFLIGGVGCSQPPAVTSSGEATGSGSDSGVASSSGAAGNTAGASATAAAPAGVAVITPVAAPVLGEVVPDIDGLDTDGERFKLSDYRGKVVMIDFWGDW